MRCFPREAVVFFLKVLVLGQQLFPAFFQTGRHQAIRGIDRLITLLGEFSVVAGSLQALLPKKKRRRPASMAFGRAVP